MSQIFVTLLIAFILALLFGKYLYKIATNQKMFVDYIFNPIDNLIYKICGIRQENMTWKHYALHFVAFNAIVTFFSYIILRLQHSLLFNPNNTQALSTDLSFNVVVSFITNTNLQHYSGETALSYFSQSSVILLMMFISAASGYSVCMAFCRGVCGLHMGNYYRDMTRIITRVMLPLSFILALVLISQGVPQTFEANLSIHTLEGKFQNIALGPVASLESIKHLGTNGGGFFNANSSMPFENPNALTNLLEILAMTLLPSSCVVAFGHMIHFRHKQSGFILMGKDGAVIFGAMSIIFLIGLGICYFAEHAGNPVVRDLGINQTMGNMEGKELRFGTTQSSLFTAITTSFTTGSVNNTHDSLTPLAGAVPLLHMILNAVFGGEGVGLMSMIVYILLAVFLCALMIGRTPEYLGKKIEAREMKLVALIILIHPLLVLILSAFGIVFAKDTLSNPGFHGLSQMLYEFSSATANNGSGFEGLNDNTLFWNISTAIAMFCGRYLVIIAQLAIAGSLLAKRTQEHTSGTLQTNNFTFLVVLVFVIYIFAALTFFPALALGPIAEHLLLWH